MSWYPCNPSLEEEISRLLARPALFPSNNASTDSDDDFERNGITRDFYPELATPRKLRGIVFEQHFDPPFGIRRSCANNNNTLSSSIVSTDSAQSNNDLRSSGSLGSSSESSKSKSHPLGKTSVSKMAAVCAFCRNNGEDARFYRAHDLRDASGKISCPILRAYTCPLCGASGDNSHTLKYCPNNLDKNGSGIYKSTRTSAGRKKTINPTAKQFRY